MKGASRKYVVQYPGSSGLTSCLCEYASGAATRDEAIRVAYRSGGYTMQAIAAHFGVHYSTVSRAVRGYKI